MPVFISYSHQDSEFALELASQLVIHKAKVWIDKWELHVGDSLINRIQDAISGASALLVILSKSSVKSEWCKKELSVGLIRELGEKKVIVLPVLKEQCDVPLFLQDKVHADFRTNFDEGLQVTLEAIAHVTSDTLGRFEEPTWHTDWSINWGLSDDGLFSMRVTIVEQTNDQPYSCLTTMTALGDDLTTKRYIEFKRAGLDWFEAASLLLGIGEAKPVNERRILLKDAHPVQMKFVFSDPKTRAQLYTTIESQRLGKDTGRNILLDVGNQIREISKWQMQVHRKLTQDELYKIQQIQKTLEKS